MEGDDERKGLGSGGSFLKVIEEDFGGVLVRVWRPFGMRILPAHGMGRMIREEVARLRRTGRRRSAPRHPDLGAWSALTAVSYDPGRMALDVRFVAILIHPGSPAAVERFRRMAREDGWYRERDAACWDSRAYDEGNGYWDDAGGDDACGFDIFRINGPDDFAENTNTIDYSK